MSEGLEVPGIRIETEEQGAELLGWVLQKTRQLLEAGTSDWVPAVQEMGILIHVEEILKSDDRSEEFVLPPTGYSRIALLILAAYRVGFTWGYEIRDKLPQVVKAIHLKIDEVAAND